MAKYIEKDIDDYMKKITPAQAKVLLKHCNANNIKPEIIAWYDNMADFYSDWVGNIGDTKQQARDRLKDIDFVRFGNGEIVRLSY